jgi:hypothetical protein
MEPKIIVATPTRGLIFTEALNALNLELIRNEQFGFPLYTLNVPLPDSRNQLIETALKESYWTHILLLDDDVVIPEGGLKAMLDLDTDIAVIDYPHHMQGYDKETLKDLSYGTCVFSPYKPEDGYNVEGKELIYGGLGCTLVKREVIEKLDKPMFKESSYVYRRKPDGTYEVTDTEAGMSKETKGAGEDVYFFKQAKKAGYEAKAVVGKVAKHLRLTQALPRLAMGRYRSSHNIQGNDTIDKPLL